MKPASTSPEPAVASPGLPLALMSHEPSGCASTLPAAFQHDVRVELARERFGGGETVALDRRGVAGEQSRGLGGMRRQHDGLL